MKRTLALLAITGGLLVSGGSPALANHTPVGGCPTGDGFFLFPVEGLIEGIDNGSSKDQNNDGFVCARVNKGQTDKNGGFPSFTTKDNTNPLP